MTPADVISGAAQWVVLHADNADVLPALAAKSVAHVITDPPYSEHTHGKSRAGHKMPDGHSRERELGFDALAIGDRERLALEFARLSCRWQLIFSDQESVSDWRHAVIAAGVDHVRIGQWVKLGASPQFSGDRPANGCEPVEVAHAKGRKRWNGGGNHAVWTHPIVTGSNSERTSHTTQKPLPLMLELVELFTDPGDVVLDPFCGSGTTGVACIRLGRRFIGIEKHGPYTGIARERLEAESRGLTLRDSRAGQLALADIWSGP